MFSFEGIDTCFDYCYNTRCDNIIFGPVVQLVSTPPCHGGGRRFEPDQGRWSSLKSCSCFENWGLSSAGRAPALQAGGHRFEPCRPQLFSNKMRRTADVAQLAEQLICNQQVIGSSPIIGLYGWVPERPKGADCKSVVSDFGGSNPPPSI